ERGLRLVRELRKGQAGRVARVGAEDAEPAGVRDDGDAAALRQRRMREEDGGVDELFERTRTQHAGVAEERVDRGLRTGERRGVGARSLRSGARAAGLEREDRL